MLFDVDFGFGGNAEGQYDSNTLALATASNASGWPNPAWSTLLLRRLLENEGFRNEFIQRMAAHVNTTFAPERVIRVIDSLQAAIAPEIPRHKARWPQSLSLGSGVWENNVEVMRQFARQRPGWIRSFFYDHFDLSGAARLTIVTDEPAGGTVYAHGAPLPGPSFGAVFFKDVPVRLEAVPAEGFVFAGWAGAASASADTLSLVLTENTTLTARFAREGATPAEGTEALPHATRLSPPFPNPFSAQTEVTFELARPAAVSLRVYDLLGRVVATLVEGPVPGGSQHVTFEAAHLPSGVYFIRLQAGDFTETRRVNLLR
jgi:hypothetical protein